MENMKETVTLWTVKTTLDKGFLEKETKKMGEEFNRLKDLINNVLRKYPFGITEDALLHELPANEDHEAVRYILSFMTFEQSVKTTVGYCL